MQMALPVTLPDDETFTSYFGGENSLEVSHLKDAFTKLNNKFIKLEKQQEGKNK